MAFLKMYKIIITLLLCCCATAYGAEVDNTLLKKNLEAANLQVEVLKAQVEVMKSYQDKFLSTVYWSLGGVFGIVVLLVGYNWFTNFKNQEKEEKYFKDLISINLSSAKTELLDALNTEKSVLETSIMDRLNQNTDNKLREIQRNISKIDSEHQKLLIEIFELQYDKWCGKENDLLMIRMSIKLLKQAKKLNYSYRISLYLEGLVSNLKNIQRNSRKVSVDILSDVTNCIKILENEHEATCNVIKKLLDEIAEK